MRTVRLGAAVDVPALGQGTWNLGDVSSKRRAELATLRRGIELGLTVIDTAEMYGNGASESLIGEAVRGLRDKVTLVSKVYPQNAGRQTMRLACEASLRRLGIEFLDLYLLHWPGSVPLAETVEAFERLVEAGKIRRWGVSNFDVDDMDELFASGGVRCATNQVLYNLTRRGPEFDLFPWMAGHGMAVMAYSPIEQGRLPPDGPLRAVADKHGASVAQVALAFTIRSGQVMAIPKASSVAHVEDNARAAEVRLDRDDLELLDRAFPPPRQKRPLEML